MALQLWMPLRGNLDNLGLMQLPSASYLSFSVYTAGKIGNAIRGQAVYHFTEDPFPNTWSIACWVKFMEGYSEYNNIILCMNTSGSEDAKFYLSIINNTTLNIGRGSSGSLNYSPTGGFILNTWYHLAATFDGNITCLYINGELVRSGLVGVSKTALNLCISCRSVNANGTSQTGSSFPLNDVRIYDHALSQAEVHSLSQGLVVHYKMDDESHDLHELNTKANYTVIASCPMSSISSTFGLANGDTYTYSVNVVVPTDKKVLKARIQYYTDGNNQTGPTGIVSVTNGVGRISVTDTLNSTKMSYTTFLLLIDYNSSSDISTTNIPCYWNDIQIEVNGNVVYKDYTLTYIQDHSGYQNNGTIVGNLTVSDDSPRYDKSLYFSSSSNYITHQNVLDNTSQEWTVCCWVKPNQVSQAMQLNSFNLGNRIIHDITNMRALLYINDSTNDYYRYSSNNAIAYNEWFHIAFVFNYSEDIVSIYVNGLNVDSSKAGNNSKTPKGLTDTILVLNTFIGYACDYREYSTALSSDDILSLYQLGARIDNKKNLHTFEIEENGLELPLKIQRNGVSVCNEFIESDDASIRFDGTTESNNIYEI